MSEVQLQEIGLMAETVSLEEMAGVLKNLGLTPYYFMSKAVQKAMLDDDFVSAGKYLDYADEFKGRFFTNNEEDQAFQIILKTIRSFIKKYKTAGV